MEAAVDALVAAAAETPRLTTYCTGVANTLPTRLTASWRLAWTSERETLFLLEKFPGGWGGEFGNTMKSTKAYQRIDVVEQSLANAVVFCNGNEFVVDSVIRVEGPERVTFKFTGARLELKKPFKFTLNLPPVGAGWFDNVYVDETLRAARDSRGDLLIVVRDESLEARGLA